MLDMAPAALAGRSPADGPQVFAAEGPRRKRVALLAGCAQPVLKPGINEATIRLLNSPRRRGGYRRRRRLLRRAAASHGQKRSGPQTSPAPTSPPGSARSRAKGSTPSSLTRRAAARRSRTMASCSARTPPGRKAAARVSALARDVSEFVAEIGLSPVRTPEPMTLAYHSACSLQHGQKIAAAPKRLLETCGFAVRDVPEGHLCCGSAGTYNILQPALARQLRDRKIANIESTRPTPSPPAISAASCRSPAAPAFPCSTPWNCSTGQPAVRVPRASRSVNQP